MKITIEKGQVTARPDNEKDLRLLMGMINHEGNGSNGGRKRAYRTKECVRCHKKFAPQGMGQHKKIHPQIEF